jgi:hypothetical protein
MIVKENPLIDDFLTGKGKSSTINSGATGICRLTGYKSGIGGRIALMRAGLGCRGVDGGTAPFVAKAATGPVFATRSGGSREVEL